MMQKVLYVDDERLNLMLFRAHLEKKYNVLTADSGADGLVILKEHSGIRVVVSDMKMPQMNGIEFIKKALEIAPDTVFYILTGFEITPEIQQALDEGLIRKYFRKPFNIKEISAEIDLGLGINE
jgi:two-component system, response regulator, stage 0 sporulation protein F